jgi:major type 1 subunit fimbrin (pilin)
MNLVPFMIAVNDKKANYKNNNTANYILSLFYILKNLTHEDYLYTKEISKCSNAENAGTVNFTGTIIASACSLNNGSPLVVPLGTHSVTAFTGVASTTGQRNIDLNLTGCPALTATITFLGDGQVGATNLLRLTPGSAPESHIAIALFEADGTPLPINTASSTPHTLTGTNNITYKAAYKQHTAGTVPIGVAPGTATLDIQYN